MIYLCSYHANIGMMHFFYKKGKYYQMKKQSSLLGDGDTEMFGCYIPGRNAFIICEPFDYDLPQVLEYVDLRMKPSERIIILQNIVEQKIFEKL